MDLDSLSFINLSEAIRAAGKKSKKTPGEENPKIMNAAIDWTKMLGRVWFDR